MKIKTLKWCILFGVLVQLFFVHSLAAQLRLNGTVFDAQSKQPIEFATIRIFNLADSLLGGTVTNEKGNFNITLGAVGKLIIKVNYISFNQYTDTINITNNKVQINLGRINLLFKTKELSEIQINANKNNIKDYIDRTEVVFDTADIRKAPVITNALRKIPGISVQQSTGIITMVGSENLLILVNGIAASSTALKAIKTENVEKIELIASAGAEYNAEYSSVINIILKREKKYGLYTDLSATLYAPFTYSKSDAQLKYGFGKIILTADYDFWMRRSVEDTDIKYSILENGTQMEYISRKIDSKKRLQYWHYFNYGVDYLISDKSILSFFGSAKNYKQHIPSSQTTRVLNNGVEVSQIEQTHVSDYNDAAANYSLHYRTELNNGKHLSIAGNYYNANMQFNESVAASTTNSDGTTENYQVSNNIFRKRNAFSVETSYRQPFLKDGKMSIGYSFFMQNVGQDIKSKNDESAVDFNNQKNSAFINFNKKFSNIGIVAGFRYEYYSYTGETTSLKAFSSYLPSISLSYKLNKQSNLYLNFRSGMQYPAFWLLNPLKVYTDSLEYRVGNPALEPEKTDRIEFSYTYRTGKMYVNPKIYYSKTNNLITQVQNIEQSGVRSRIWDNYGNSSKTGLLTNAQFSLFGIIDLSPSIDLFYLNFKTEQESWRGWSYEVSISAEYGINDNLTVGAGYYYQQRKKISQGFEFINPLIEVYVNYIFLNDRASLQLTLEPLDGISKTEYIQNQFTYSETILEHYKNVNIKFSYSLFKGLELKDAMRKNIQERDF